MKPQETEVISFYREHSKNPFDSTICRYLTEYLGTAYCRYEKSGDTWKRIQPGWPGEEVFGYQEYRDSERVGGKQTRLMIMFKSGKVTDISVSEFKKYLRLNE